MPTDTDAATLARRAWASKAAREAAAQAIIVLTNGLAFRGYEKREALAHLEANPGYATEILAALQELAAERAAEPDHAGLHEWGRRQRFSRAYGRQEAGVSEPSYFNTKREYTTK